MRYQGRLSDWNDDKGYGFVTPNGGGERAFVHIKAFERSGRRPREGELISYVAERDARGRCNATRIRLAATRASAARAPATAGTRKLRDLAWGFSRWQSHSREQCRAGGRCGWHGATSG